MRTLRGDLPELPKKMRHLPLDHRGFPTPWFVATLEDGTRDFRIASTAKRVEAVKKKLCWVCGDRLGRFKSFVIGPMCAVSRTTSEPPCHLECAIFSATACPFLSKPRMKRNDKDFDDIGVQPAPGYMIERNPGCVCVWTTLSYKPFKVAKDDWLITMGDPVDTRWYAEGHMASREQVLASVDSGYPILLDEARKEGPESIIELAAHRAKFEKLLPRD